jgi:hypothetical protein
VNAWGATCFARTLIAAEMVLPYSAGTVLYGELGTLLDHLFTAEQGEWSAQAKRRMNAPYNAFHGSAEFSATKGPNGFTRTELIRGIL